MTIRGSSKIYHAGLYYRLSIEDAEVARRNKDESSSISNQKILIKDFLKDKYDIQVYGEYTDDGVSGSSFERPDFNRMMEDIEAGRINCVIVKDLSRFGREYIEAGNLLERVFPSLGVRFIAINDNIDTKDGLDTLMVALKNIMNDAYCRDISIKTRSNLAVKRRHGELVAAFAKYGYMKDPNNHNKLIVDDYAAHIVENIFIWKIQGHSCYSIASKLNSLGVLSPMEYKIQQGSAYSTSFKIYEHSEWSAKAVRRILEDETYVGTLVQGKYSTPNHKVKKVFLKDKNQWVRVENTHDSIVSKHDFDLVQKTFLLDTRAPEGEDKCYPLSGIVVCGDCGTNLIRKPRTVGGKIYVYYECQEYRSSKGKRCERHSIRDVVIENVVLDAIKCQIALVLELDECMKQLDLTMISELDRNRINKQIAACYTEIERNQAMIARLYTDLRDEVITKEEYINYKAEFESKKYRAEKELLVAEDELSKVERNESKHYAWVENFIKYQNVSELTREMVIELVDSVTVYDKKHVEITLAFQDEYNEAIKALSDMVLKQNMEVKACG